MKEVVIVSALRTPIGAFGGSLKEVSAVDLGVHLLKESLTRLNLNPNQVDEVIIGNVLGAGLGQNIARQIALKSGLPETVSAFTLNKVCGSGMKAVTLAAQAIQVGESDIVIAGGTENMSQAPYLLPNQRWGSKLGNVEVKDLLLSDGLTDAFDHVHMGITAENIADQYGISRQAQDQFALESQEKAQKALASHGFQSEIAPLKLVGKKGAIIQFNQDEYPRQTSMEALAKLKPAFKKDGTVTAGNASGINDGAALLVLMSRDKAESLGLQPLASLKAYASAGVDPKVMGLGPVPASQKALEKAGLQVEDLDLIEANEAFASQALCVQDGLNLDPEKVNVNGGAIALGHPIGASGARILVSLLHEMERSGKNKGMATLCIGGGQGISVIVERDQ